MCHGKEDDRYKAWQKRRVDTDEMKPEAVQMLLDGHSAASVAANLGITRVHLLDQWKARLLNESGPSVTPLESRVRELEEALRRVERELDILKKAWSILGQRT